ncbi:hypothetical protein EIL87_18335 [Saccharopolyspora rhizosphaerae]|uniref:DUF7577 domain-containing protein n=1 Tax=Saccharopolyspora rhizosphaerae TaxID=2492662 RepID=A0A426JNI6_9PSEU|nr:hypothetical protein [Saccharopolyspora rhizosphaerae]RRO14706.1 hypothetical protein EIL87_18335 [Saccharopolyspora rhizosphaerae]
MDQMKCHSCGVTNEDDFVLCWKCGRPRAAEGAAGGGLTRLGEPAARVVPGTGFNRDATRYLCAALQMNAGLNELAHKHLLREEYRSITSSPGIDLVTVLKWGVAARSRQLTRDVLLVVLLLIGLGLLSSPEPEWVLLPLFAGWAVMFVETLSTYYGVLARHFRRSCFNPANAPAPTSEATRKRLEAVSVHDRGNVTVFANYGPFAGHGTPFGNWSFTLNVAKAAEGEEAIDFTTAELRDFVADAVRGIGLPGVMVEDRVFVSGQDLLHGLEAPVKQAILPDELAAPASRVDEPLIAQLREDPQSRARPYLVVRVGGWSGELVVTMFLRFALMPRKDQLYVEANYSLLRPLQERYQHVDRLLGNPTPRQFVRLAGSSLARFVPTTFGAVQRIWGVVIAPVVAEFTHRREKREITHERSFNYGAVINLRERASDFRYHRYFQSLDKEMYSKLAERRVVDALEEFLEAHNIDTSDLRERQTTILNSGIYVSGQGSFKAGSVAVGRNPISHAFARAGSTFARAGAAVQNSRGK